MELRFTYAWARFVQRLRQYYNEGKDIPTISSPQPQLQVHNRFKGDNLMKYFCFQYSLLQQKIEMLQYCIRQKQNRERLLSSINNPSKPDPLPGVSGVSNPSDGENETETDDEFYDAEGDSNDVIDDSELEADLGVDRISSMCLLKFDSKHINIPVLQQPPPMTEDLLAKREEEMTALGTGEEGKKQRLKLQSKVLEYDMMAFKAANGGCTFEDFVRWHSPSDWSPESGLSGRMTLPGNIWVELWESAKAIPASKQQRLFDDTHEAETILRDFNEFNLAQITELILPIIIHESLRNAIRTVIQQ